MASAVVYKLALALVAAVLIGTCCAEAKLNRGLKPLAKPPKEYDLHANGHCPPRQVGFVRSCCKQNVTGAGLHDDKSGSYLITLIQCSQLLAKKAHELLNDEDVGDFEFPEVCCGLALFKPMCKQWNRTVNDDLRAYQMSMRDELAQMKAERSRMQLFDDQEDDQADDQLSYYADTSVCERPRWNRIKGMCCKIREKPAPLVLNERARLHGRRMKEFWRCVRELTNNFYDDKRGIPGVCCKVPFFRLLCEDKRSTTTTHRPEEMVSTTMRMDPDDMP